MRSPYDAARDGGASPPAKRRMPALAVVGSVPTAARYAAPGAAPVLGILLPFRRLFVTGGTLRSVVALDKEPDHKCYRELSPMGTDEEIYVNFGEHDLGLFVEENPEEKGEYSLKNQAFVDMVYKRYQAYRTPGPYEFCVKDAGYARAMDLVNMCGGAGPWTTAAEKPTPTQKTETVETFWERMWRSRSPGGRLVESVLIVARPVGACYQSDKFLFAPSDLEPNNDDETVLTDNITYHTKVAGDVATRVRQINALLCAFTRWGDLAGLHPTYVKAVEKLRVEVGGHTDDILSVAHNQALSWKRAEGVMAHLCAKMKEITEFPESVVTPLDATSDRLVTKGYASTECPTKQPQKDRACRKITLRLVSGP